MTASAYQRVMGHCPMGCGETLFLGEGGYITCSYGPCPEPDIVATLLEDRESEHIVQFGAADFVIRHPLRERDEPLLHCEFHAYCTSLPFPPVPAGRYRAVKRDGVWTFGPADGGTER